MTLLGPFIFASIMMIAAVVMARDLMRRADEREARLKLEHREDLKVLATAHAADLERVHGIYERVMTSQANLLNFGTMHPPPAESTPGMTTAADRLARAIDTETVARGVEHLRREYASIGLTLPDEELEAEAKALLMGENFEPGRSLAARYDMLAQRAELPIEATDGA